MKPGLRRRRPAFEVTAAPGPPVRNELLCRVAGGLVGVWEQQGSWMAGARLYRPAGLVVAASGLGPGLDTVIAAGRGPDEPARALDVAATLLAAHGAPLWLDLVSGAHPALERAALERGMRPAVRRPVMVAPIARARPREWHDAGRGGGPEVARADDLAALRALYAECFGMPRSYAERVMTPAALLHPQSVRLVWRHPSDGVVAMAAAHLVAPGGASTDVAIFGVATRPRDRGRGIAGALVETAVAVGAARGATLAWLMAEPGAVGVYRRAGFEVVGSQVAWAGGR